MDNDDYRRGKPSNHKVFGEDIALLAGDALQALAFKTATSHITDKNASRVARAVNNLAYYCGAEGMVGGQVIDLESEGKNVGIERLREMDRKKTGAIIKSACEMGCIIAGADENKIENASDLENEKSTYVSLLGIEKCSELVQNLTHEALKNLEAFDGDSETLRKFALSLAEREY